MEGLTLNYTQTHTDTHTPEFFIHFSINIYMIMSISGMPLILNLLINETDWFPTNLMVLLLTQKK